MRLVVGNLSALATGTVFVVFGLCEWGIAGEYIAAPAMLLVDASATDANANSITVCAHEACADAADHVENGKPTPLCADTCGVPDNSHESPGCADECSSKTNECPLCFDGCSCRSPWYVSVSGGWEQREIVHEVDDARTFIKFHGGFLANAAFGVRCDSFRLEFETSFMNNGVDLAGAGGLSSSAAGNVNLHAYMFNVYHDVEFKNCCWKPYVGAGIGTYQSELNGLNPEFFDQLGAPFAGQPVNATSDMPFAYQFRVGVSRPLGCHAELYSGYRYFRGEELEFASAPFASFGSTFHPDGAKVHAVELGVRVNF
jgi:opacity protein-like surface antigen